MKEYGGCGEAFACQICLCDISANRRRARWYDMSVLVESGFGSIGLPSMMSSSFT